MSASETDSARAVCGAYCSAGYAAQRSSSCQGVSYTSASTSDPKARGQQRRRSSVAPCARAPPCPPSPPSPCFDDACDPCCLAMCCEHLAAMGRKLMKAAASGKTGCVRRMLSQGADVNFIGPGGTTALHKAASESHPCVVTLLLNCGANPNERTCSGLTALHLAAGNDFCGRCVAALLEAGADLGSRSRCGRTPLHFAAIAGNEVAVRALVAAGASEIAEDDRGKTPYMVAKTILIRRLLRNCCRKKRPNCLFRPPDCTDCCSPDGCF